VLSGRVEHCLDQLADHLNLLTAQASKASDFDVR
jgi:hypothetical protein